MPKGKRVKIDGRYVDMMGKESDATIARLVGCCTTTILRLRTRLGIAANPMLGIPRGIDWDTITLGMATDKEIAASVGCSKEAVQQARAARDIPSYRRYRKLLRERQQSVDDVMRSQHEA